jgi:hypothetical protein
MLRHGRAARGVSTGDPPRRGRAQGLANAEHHAPLGTAVPSATHKPSIIRRIVAATGANEWAVFQVSLDGMYSTGEPEIREIQCSKTIKIEF